jgi:NDP-sugar pyrophosphorylase family protein
VTVSHDEERNMSTPTLVIMAAGVGRRYGGLKQIEAVGPGGETILSYAVYDAVRAGFGKVVFIIREEIEEAFRDVIGRRIEAHVATDYVFQELDRLPEGFHVPEGRQKPWGTGHAVLCCKDVVAEPFAVINADDFYGPSSYRVLADVLRATEGTGEPYDWALVGFDLPKTLSPHGTVARGICDVSPEGYLVDVVEHLKVEAADGSIRDTEEDGRVVALPADSVVSMNMWGFTPGLFDELEAGFERFLRDRGTEMKSEYLLPEVVGRLVRAGRARVKVLPSHERWYGVTYRDDLPRLRAALAERVAAGDYPSELWPRA